MIKNTNFSSKLTHNLLDLCRGHQAKIRRHGAILQLALATLQTLSSDRSEEFDQVLAAEKGFLQSLSEDFRTAQSQVLRMLRAKVEDENGRT